MKSPLRSAATSVFTALVVVMAIAGSSVFVGTASATTTPGRGAGSVTEAYLTGATPGARVTLRDGTGSQVGSGVVDRLGSLIVRDLTPGPGFHFDVNGVAGNRFSVLDRSGSSAPASLYRDQHLHPGLNYIRMRDGITLAATVHLPLGKTAADGPFPTVIEYSGYQTAAPGNFYLGAAAQVAKHPDPLAPAISTVLGGVLAPAAGFASVSVQMRGSGCSGGAFDIFDWPTILDGYDAIETVAAQPWVAGHRVGMVGISFSAISQWAVAGMHPPHLAAIAPLSTTDDLYSTGYPGGILNTGFANTWLTERQADARPAPGGGQPYAKALVAQGDKQCAANQQLRLQTPDLLGMIEDNPTRNIGVYEHRSPQYWASKVSVPVFLAGALQDEQVGSQWTNLIPALDRNPNVWVKMINGAHFDSLAPQILGPWNEFLNLFVAHRIPPKSPALEAHGPALYLATTSGLGQPVDSSRFADAPSYQAALNGFRRDGRVQVFFGNGTGSAGVGGMSAPWWRSYDAWPPSNSTQTRLSFGTGGALSSQAGAAAQVSFRPDPAARPAGTLNVTGPSQLPWKGTPPYDWAPVPGHAGVSFVTAPQARDAVVIGQGAVALKLHSSAPVTDLQATISEVRPDGKETFVASGLLRARVGHQAPGQFTDVAIPLDPIGYAFRAGSRLRVTITAPGGDRTSWRFATPANGGQVVDTLALGTGGSALVLPVVDGQRAGTPLPSCVGVRGQPCRTYVRTFNGG